MLLVACVWLATAALLVAALAHVRDDEQDARLDALEREVDAVSLAPLPDEVQPVEPRPPIGFRSE